MEPVHNLVYTQSYFDTVLWAATSPAFVLDTEFCILGANLYVNDLFQKPLSEIEGNSLTALDGSLDHSALKELIDEAVKTPGASSLKLVPVTINNHKYEARARVLPYRSDKGAATLLLVLEDAYERNYAEERRVADAKRTESEESFRIIADTAPVLIWMSDTSKNCIFFNKGWLDFTGRKFEDEIGTGWADNVHPDDFERCLNIYQSNFDLQNEFYMEYRLKHHSGEYRWISDRGVPRYDIYGSFTGYIGGCIDIHEQKTFSEALEAKVERRTRELDKRNLELASFAYIASHDLQEPLRKTRMFLNRIAEKEKGKLGDETLNYFNRILSTTDRMQNLINDLLSYSKVNAESLPTEKTDLNILLKEVLASIDEEIHEKETSITYDELPVIDAIPTQIKQVFCNIILNAIKYSKPDVAPSIHIIAGEEAVNGKLYYTIAFRDNGIGFEEQYKDTIFEVFQRLHSKTEYTGSGIGLAICKKIMQNHHGDISATSKPGEGSIFTICFPVTNRSKRTA